MNLRYYPYFASNDFQVYSFYSDGPKGKIKKTVLYIKIQENPIIYNLAFGDADPETGEINDNVKSNNEDRDIVLATVARTVYDFSNRYGNHYIFATGNNPVRTRLYQMSISQLIDEISQDFEVFGVIGDKSYNFQQNVNYDGFIVKRR